MCISLEQQRGVNGLAQTFTGQVQPVGCKVTPEQARHPLPYSLSRSKAPNLFNF